MKSEISPLVRFIEPPPRDERAKGFTVEERVVLDEVNQKVAAEESIESIIDFLFNTTKDICPCDRIGLSFVEEDGQRVVSYYDVASYKPLLLDKGYAEDVAGSTLKKVIEKGVPRIIDDLDAYLARKPTSNSTKLLVKEGVRSSMTCPLEVNGKNVGLLFRSSRKKGVYGEHEAYLHLAVAERLSQAVEKAWRIKQLTDANRSYFETLGFVSHELKSPLAAIVMSGKALTEDVLGKMDPKQRDMVERMVHQAEMLLGQIREYLDLSRIEGGGMKLNLERRVSLWKEIVEPTLESLSPQIEERHSKVEIDVEKELKVDCDPGLLSIVMMNLVGNAVKYGNAGGRVRVKATEEGGLLKCSVWNEGAGFTEEQKRALFKKFSRVNDPELMKRKGTGLGLYTTWRLVNLHGGKIRADSEKGKWAEFSFQIPLKNHS